MMKRIGVLLLLASFFTGCASVEPQNYASETPVLELERYFDRTIDGWGMVQDRSGKVLRRFRVTIQPTWSGTTGTLDEAFVWSDGKTERRVWTLTAAGNGRYRGRAADVIGEAAGHAAGNALRWNYVLKLPADQGGYEVDIDDWMYLIDPDTLLNRSDILKFGIRFATITIAFRKR